MASDLLISTWSFQSLGLREPAESQPAVLGLGGQEVGVLWGWGTRMQEDCGAGGVWGWKAGRLRS